MDAAKRLSMVILMQKDMQKAVTFYQELGFQLLFNLEDKWTELALEDVKLGLCPTTAEMGERRTGLVFEVENLEELYQLRQEQWSFLKEPLVKVHGIMASVKDPSGNIIDLYQPTPEKVQELVKAAGKEDKPCDKGKACCKA